MNQSGTIRATTPPASDVAPRAFGLDLGTSCVRGAVFLEGAPTPVEDASGSTGFPAVACFHGGVARVGRAALGLGACHPRETVIDVVRRLGRAPTSPAAAAPGRATGRPWSPFARASSPPVGAQDVDAGEVAARVLRQPIDAARERLGVAPGPVVVAAPTWLGPDGRAALVAAARRADVPLPLVMSDVVARAIDLSFAANVETRATIVDVGAGGVSAAVVAVGWRRVEVLGVAGDGTFGGADVDSALRRSILLRLPDAVADRAAGPDYVLALQALAESVKRDLAHADPVPLPVPFLRGPAGEPVTVSLHRAALAAPLRELGERIRAVVAEALRAALLPVSAVRQLHAAGGMARIPEVLAAIEGCCGRKAQLRLGPDSAARGAALRAAMMNGEIDLALADGEPASGAARKPSAPPTRAVTDVRTRSSTLPRGLLETTSTPEEPRRRDTPPPVARRPTASGFPAPPRASAPPQPEALPSTPPPTWSPTGSTLPPLRPRPRAAGALEARPGAETTSTLPPLRPMQSASERRVRADARAEADALIDLTDAEIDAAFAVLLPRVGARP